jgi:hypothetical protein
VVFANARCGRFDGNQTDHRQPFPSKAEAGHIGSLLSHSRTYREPSQTASDRGGERAAAMYSLIVTAKMNDVDPQAWLADVLARIADHPAQKLDELLPWNWTPLNASAAAA